MNKRNAIIISSSVLVLSAIGGTTMALTNKPQAGADTSPVVQQLSNHETRIKNAENNIKDLQAKTNTPDSSSNTSVPAAPSATDLAASTASASTNTTSSASDQPIAEAPATPTVVSYREIPLDADNSDCEYTYSDGTTHRFDWKRTNQHGSWMTDSSGQNGHWVKTVQTNGICDNKVIGTIQLF